MLASIYVSYIQDQGVQEGAFKTPEKLHLTLGLIRIFSKEEEASTCSCYMHTYVCFHHTNFDEKKSGCRCDKSSWVSVRSVATTDDLK